MRMDAGEHGGIYEELLMCVLYHLYGCGKRSPLMMLGSHSYTKLDALSVLIANCNFLSLIPILSTLLSPHMKELTSMLLSQLPAV